jgi:hypothetical protein
MSGHDPTADIVGELDAKVSGPAKAYSASKNLQVA